MKKSTLIKVNNTKVRIYGKVPPKFSLPYYIMNMNKKQRKIFIEKLNTSIESSK